MCPDPVVLAGAGVAAAAALPLPGIPEEMVLRGSDDASLKAHIARRGIRYKDRATRLALVAAKRAMQTAGLAASYADLDDRRCAVVAASSFGNVDTVIRSAMQIVREGSMSLSPMDLPNASANIVPATLSIWFGLRGASLLVANGPDSGFDALQLACRLIRSGRADRVLVCGAEAEQPDLARLFEQDGRPQDAPVDVAAAIVLERADAHRARGEAPASWGFCGPRGGRAPGAAVPVLRRSEAGSGDFGGEAVQLAGAPEFGCTHGAAGLLSMLAATSAARIGRPPADAEGETSA